MAKFLLLALAQADCDVSLVQMKMELTALESAGICVEQMDWELLKKPIHEVARGRDAWCTYGVLGESFSGCARARRARDLSLFQKASGSVARALEVALPDNSKMSILNENPLEDLHLGDFKAFLGPGLRYCYVNGWYELPAEAATNYSFVEEASESFCKLVKEAGSTALPET